MQGIREKIIAIVEAETSHIKRFKLLSELSGISADTWKNVWHRRQRATEEMIAFVGKKWPDYAYWMVTGDTEPEFRHVAPKTYVQEYPIFRGEKSEAASAERRYRIALLENMPNDDEEKKVFIQKMKDATFGLKSNEKFRLDFYAFEQYAKYISSPATEELFIVASDIELTKIKDERWKEDKEKWLKARNTMMNIQTGMWFEKKIDPLKKIISWFAK
jgi:hypothetical protein